MNKASKPILISIIGPTAVGKTAFAIKLAKQLGTEILSSDSRQFYKELEIGTAKPSSEELAEVKHHFINSHSIHDQYSAGEYGRDAEKLLVQLFESFKIVVAVGGSSLYFKSLWEGFDEIPKVNASIRDQLISEYENEGLEPLLNELQMTDKSYYNEVDKNNSQRIIRALEVVRGTGKSFSSFRNSSIKEDWYEHIKIGLNMDREKLFDRINKRMDFMIDEGLFEEAKKLVEFKDHNALQTVGYKEIFDFLDDQYDYSEAVRLLKRNSRRYAKRQLTWFNRYDDISWFDPKEEMEIINHVKAQIEIISNE